MIYLLDTNACIEFMRTGGVGALADRVRAVQPTDIGVCMTVRAELYAGAYYSAKSQQNLANVKLFLQAFSAPSFDERVADRSGEIWALLERTGQQIGAFDLLIAATALVHGLAVVTHNTREFSRVPNLRIEDWQSP